MAVNDTTQFRPGVFGAAGLPSMSGGSLPPNLSLYTPGNAYLERGLATAAPSSGLSADASSAIDIINKQRDYYASLGGAQAQSLAARRGLAGSSIEQFGTQQAFGQADLASQNAIGGILTQNMSQNSALRQLQAQMLGQYGNNLNQLGSDEVASLRNLGLSQQGLALQQQLGQQGINLGYSNIDAARQLAQQQSRNSLLTSGASLLAPYLLGGGGGGFLGGGGGTGGFLGGFGGGSLSGTAYGGAGNPASSLFPNLGGVGTGTTANGLSLGGGAGLGANLGLGGAGLLAGQQAFGNNLYSNIGGVAGGIGGSLFGPVGSGVGAFAGEGLGNAYGNLNNTAKALVNPFANPGATVKAVGSGISKVGNALGLSRF